MRHTFFIRKFMNPKKIYKHTAHKKKEQRFKQSLGPLRKLLEPRHNTHKTKSQKSRCTAPVEVLSFHGFVFSNRYARNKTNPRRSTRVKTEHNKQHRINNSRHTQSVERAVQTPYKDTRTFHRETEKPHHRNSSLTLASIAEVQ
jgi:hypothetical protein